MKVKIVSLVLLLLLLSGCVVRPQWEQEEQASEPKLLEIPEQKQLASWLPPSPEESSQENLIVLWEIPDQSGKRRQEYTTTELATKGIEMTVLSLEEGRENYQAELKFANFTTAGITTSLNLYAYDRDGRLVRTESQSIFIRAGSALTQNFSFAKSSGEVRWIISLTGK